MKNGRRVFHNYIELEETKHGLWKRVTGDERKRFIDAASDLMKSPEEFKEAMRRGLAEWPKSCESAFTADAVNHIAFLGHVGCCVVTGSPEECTRVAWHTLSPSEQFDANQAAIAVLSEWRERYFQKSQLDMGFD